MTTSLHDLSVTTFLRTVRVMAGLLRFLGAAERDPSSQGALIEAGLSSLR